MDFLQRREKEIFETLKHLHRFSFVIIGGYAVNAYTLPRFSVDCDLVTREKTKIINILEEIGYIPEPISEGIPYHGNFERYVKKIENPFSVSMDILTDSVIDRQTGTIFPAEWIFEHSHSRLLQGKTITERLVLPIIDVDALVVMKCISCRSTDIRDVFMLLPLVKNRQWVRLEISQYHDFFDRWKKIKEKVFSPEFKNNLQGVFGFVDEAVFEKHKKAITLFR